MIDTIYIEENYVSFFDTNKRFHRVKGPDCTSVTGFKDWRFNGYPHRINGPATIYKYGDEYWYVHGEKIPPYSIYKTKSQ